MSALYASALGFHTGNMSLRAIVFHIFLLSEKTMIGGVSFPATLRNCSLWFVVTSREWLLTNASLAVRSVVSLAQASRLSLLALVSFHASPSNPVALFEAFDLLGHMCSAFLREVLPVP